MGFIHSGSTLLNLCLTGKSTNAWKLGRISNIVGDKSSGKTLLAIEAASMFLSMPPKGINPRVIYFEGESAFDRDYADSLGLDMNRVEFHKGVTIEQIYELIVDLNNNNKSNEGILFIVDSLDSITTIMEQKKKFGEQDFDRKAGKLSEMFRRVTNLVEDTNIHLMIISQIRYNMSPGAFGAKYTRSGGKSLEFYASEILWCYDIGKIKSSKTDMVQGFKMLLKNTKNKVALPYREVELTMLLGYGLDEIGSLINFLTNKKYGIPEECKIENNAGWFRYGEEKKMRYEELIEKIQNDPNSYDDIVNKACVAWEYLEETTKLVRKSKKELMSKND